MTNNNQPFWQSGKVWMFFWLLVLFAMMVWGILTFLFWMDSVKNLNALSIVALWLACGSGSQATLSMRKSDPKDKF